MGFSFTTLLLKLVESSFFEEEKAVDVISSPLLSIENL